MDATSFMILAQDINRYNSGIRWIQWGTTGVGVGILIVAAATLFSKSKPDTSATNIRIQRIVGVLLTLVGIGFIVYAWTAHSTV